MTGIVLAGWLLATPTQAADVRVCGAGVAAPCFDTVQLAVDAALDGDRVKIPLGLFEEAVVLDHRILTLEGGQLGGLVTRSDLAGPVGQPPLIVLGGQITLVRLALRPKDTRALEVSGGATLIADDLVAVAGTGVATDGGLVLATDSSLEFRSSSLDGGQALRNGGVIYATGGPLVLDGTPDAPSNVAGGTAGTAGGLIHADDLTIQGTNLDRGSALLGGAVAVAPGGHGSIRGSWELGLLPSTGNLRDNRATWGSVIHVGAGGQIDLSVLQMDRNVGGLIYLDPDAAIDASAIQARWTEGPLLTGSGDAGDLPGGGPSRIRESVFCQATSQTDLFSAFNVEIRNSFVIDSTALEAIANGAIDLVHNHFVGNAAAKVLATYSGTFANNLVAHNDTPGTASLMGQATVRRNLWWDNQAVDGVGGSDDDQDPIWGDPILLELDHQDCEVTPRMFPSWYGAARGALAEDGVYTGPGLPMPGAWGGLDAPLMYVENGGPMVADSWEITGDLDADEVVNFYDCKRIDPDVFPGAVDVPYDGVDSDCLGDDDYDADGDGERSAAHHPDGTDCDDTDPERGANREEIDGNGKDDDCDGWADAEIGLMPASCSSTPWPEAPVWVLVLALLTTQRRAKPANSTRVRAGEVL